MEQRARRGRGRAADLRRYGRTECLRPMIFGSNGQRIFGRIFGSTELGKEGTFFSELIPKWYLGAMDEELFGGRAKGGIMELRN